jgi:hypothetical protein
MMALLGKVLSDMLAVNSTIQELDVSAGNAQFSDSRGGPSFAQALSVGISDNGTLHCVDGTPYQSKKWFMMSAHVCCHCGQHKTQHTSR